jgi:hypothetical protein
MDECEGCGPLTRWVRSRGIEVPFAWAMGVLLGLGLGSLI